jgi:hypothetical protein
MNLFSRWTLPLLVIAPALLSPQTKNPTYTITLPGVDNTHVPYEFLGATANDVTLSHISSTGQGVLTRITVHGAGVPTIKTYLVPAVAPKSGERLSLDLIGNPSSHYVVAMASGTLGRSADRPPDDQVMSILDRDTLKLRSVHWITGDSSLTGFDNAGFFFDNFITVTRAKQGGSTHFRAFHLPQLTRLADCDRPDKASPLNDPCASLFPTVGATDYKNFIDVINPMDQQGSHSGPPPLPTLHPAHDCRPRQSSSTDGQFDVYECPDFTQPNDPGSPDDFYQIWQDATNHLVAKIRIPGGKTRARGMLSADGVDFFYLYSEPNLLRLYRFTPSSNGRTLTPQ